VALVTAAREASGCDRGGPCRCGCPRYRPPRVASAAETSKTPPLSLRSSADCVAIPGASRRPTGLPSSPPPRATLRELDNLVQHAVGVWGVVAAEFPRRSGLGKGVAHYVEGVFSPDRRALPVAACRAQARPFARDHLVSMLTGCATPALENYTTALEGRRATFLTTPSRHAFLASISPSTRTAIASRAVRKKHMMAFALDDPQAARGDRGGPSLSVEIGRPDDCRAPACAVPRLARLLLVSRASIPSTAASPAAADARRGMIWRVIRANVFSDDFSSTTRQTPRLPAPSWRGLRDAGGENLADQRPSTPPGENLCLLPLQYEESGCWCSTETVLVLRADGEHELNAREPGALLRAGPDGRTR